MMILDTERMYFSDRHVRLLYSVTSDVRPEGRVLTVEAYSKWYALFLVDHYAGTISRVEFHDLPVVDDESQFVDNVPNPKSVKLYANERGLTLDDLSFETIIGRWELESKGRY